MPILFNGFFIEFIDVLDDLLGIVGILFELETYLWILRRSFWWSYPFFY